MNNKFSFKHFTIQNEGAHYVGACQYTQSDFIASIILSGERNHRFAAFTAQTGQLR